MTDRDTTRSQIGGLTVAAGVARALFRFAVSKGAQPGELAERSGIVAKELDDPDARVSLGVFVALMKAGQAMTADPALALHFAEEVDLSEFSVVGLVTHACAVMGDAFAQLARYNRLVSEHDPARRPRFERHPASAGRHWLVDTRPNPNAFPEATEMALARLVVGPRHFDATPFCREARFTYPAPAYRSEYDRIFQAPLVFESDMNAILVDDEWSLRPIAPRQQYAFAILSDHAEALLRSLDALTSVRTEVERELMSILHTGDVGMAAIAVKLGVSRQTLLRRLKAEGVTYEFVLNALRRRLADGYLANRRVSVDETAYLLGFSDRAAFSRAYKRWTGTTPRGRAPH